MINKKLTQIPKDKIISHPHLVRLTNEILARIHHDDGTGFGLLAGATGVGKTTLIRRLVHLLGEYLRTVDGVYYTPPLVLTMYSPERTYFSWLDFYISSLKNELSVPFVDLRKNFDKIKHDYIEEGIPRLKRGQSIPQLRRAFIEAVNNRNPIALFIDEVQELSKVTSTTKTHDNLDVLKSLSDAIKVPIIAFGTTKAYEMLYQNEQIARRADVFQFPRYSHHDKDLKIFKNILFSLEKELNVPFSKGLIEDVNYFHLNTLGCVGILMDWIKRSLSLAIQCEHRVLKKEILDVKKLNQRQIQAITNKIKYADNIHKIVKDFNPIEILDIGGLDSSEGDLFKNIKH